MLARTQGTCLYWKKTCDGNVWEILIISSFVIEVSYNTNYYKTNWFDEHHVEFYVQNPWCYFDPLTFLTTLKKPDALKI